jgi:hypothetical protein
MDVRDKLPDANLSFPRLPNMPTDIRPGYAVNQARAMRILEIMNDFRSVQLHISSHVTRAQSNPPDQASYYHDGYVVMRQCSAEAQAILATHFNPGNLGLQNGSAGDGEIQKATMQRCVAASPIHPSILLTCSIPESSSTLLPAASKPTRSTFAPQPRHGGPRCAPRSSEAKSPMDDMPTLYEPLTHDFAM